MRKSHISGLIRPADRAPRAPPPDMRASRASARETRTYSTPNVPDKTVPTSTKAMSSCFPLHRPLTCEKTAPITMEEKAPNTSLGGSQGDLMRGPAPGRSQEEMALASSRRPTEM